MDLGQSYNSSAVCRRRRQKLRGSVVQVHGSGCLRLPSEHSSGPTQHRGELTRTGNTRVRRILIEAAWNYRFAARVGESLQPRLEGQPQDIVAIAWKAQVRLCTRFRRLRARNVHHNKVTAAIARELCGFIWEIGRRVSVSGAG